jgi:hypothetical protein
MDGPYAAQVNMGWLKIEEWIWGNPNSECPATKPWPTAHFISLKEGILPLQLSCEREREREQCSVYDECDLYCYLLWIESRVMGLELVKLLTTSTGTSLTLALDLENVKANSLGQGTKERGN